MALHTPPLQLLIMKTPKTPLAFAIAAVLLGLAAVSPAHAGLVTSTASVGFDYSTGVSDTAGGGTTTLNNVALGNTALAKFDPALGVLTGTSLRLTSNRTQTTSVTSTNGPDNGNNNSRTATGTGSSTAGLAAAGFGASLGSISQSDSCTAPRLGSCDDGPTGSVAATNGSFGVALSNGYVGNGSVSVQATLPTLTATQSGGQFTGIESTAYQLRWAGALALTYEYLLHAAASFRADGSQGMLDLDFGNVALGSAATLGFGLFNLSDPNRVGLDLDLITGSGDIGKLTTDLALFDALGAGDNNLFQAMLDTSTAGQFEASYLLDLSDADVGAGSSRFGHALTLNLRGNVFDPPSTDVGGNTRDPRNDVPEPTTLALGALALLGVAATRRRKPATPAP